MQDLQTHTIQRVTNNQINQPSLIFFNAEICFCHRWLPINTLTHNKKTRILEFMPSYTKTTYFDISIKISPIVVKIMENFIS